MRFGATRRGFESRPLRHRLAGALVVALTTTTLAACALGPAPVSPSTAPAAPSRSDRASASTAPAPSPGEVARLAAASAFAFQLDALPPVDRTTVLAELVEAIGTRLDGLPVAAADEELLRIASIGKFRLDDQTLLRRLQLEAKAMLGVDVPTCAALARGELQFGRPSPRMAALMAALSPAERLESARITVAAVRAEASGLHEPRPLSSPERTAIVSAIAKASPPDELTRLHDLSVEASAGKTLSDEDACWLMRVPYRALDRLTGADLALLGRYVLGTMSG
jgi:hypothetical protein